MRRTLRPFGWLVLALGCTAGPTGSLDAGVTTPTPPPATVRYVLDWVAPPTPDGKPVLVQAVLRTWSLQLVPCPQAKADVGWTLVPEARADHGAAADSSLWLAAATETLPASTPAAPSPGRDVHGQPCELLWVVSAGTLASGAKPGEPAFSAVVQWSDATGTHTRTLVTPVADARKVPLGKVPAGKAWTVRLLRSTDGALDGLDLAHGDTETLAWTVLDRVVQSATVVVE